VQANAHDRLTPSKAWSWDTLVRFSRCSMRAPCAHVSKRRAGAPRNEGVLPYGLRASRINLRDTCTLRGAPNPTFGENISRFPFSCPRTFLPPRRVPPLS